MTASEGSFLGFAPQDSKGVPNRTSAEFKYLLFRQGQAAPQSITVPLDPEVGGGAMLRSVAKMGVSAAAAVDFVPRPATLGMFLKGATGWVSSRKNFVSVLAQHDMDASTHTTPFANSASAATKMWICGSGGVAGEVTINFGVGDAAAKTLTGVTTQLTTKVFKTVSRLEIPPLPAGSIATSVAFTDTIGGVIHAAISLTAVRQTHGDCGALTASVVKVTSVNDQHAAGYTLRIWGTDSSDHVIDETMYVYPYEMLETATAINAGALTNVKFGATDAGAEKCVWVQYHDGSYTHEFTLSQWDNFDAPWYTIRNAPGGLWGEEYLDGRINTLGLEFRAAQFLGGAVGALGITPARVAGTGAEPAYENWSALTYVDSGPQFIAPLADIELPSGTNVCVLQGTLACAMQIPLDEQFCIGSYYPESLDIVGRQFSINMLLKITSDDLPTQMFFDPAYAGSDAAASWVAEIFRNANFKLEFVSDQDAATNKPTGVTIDYRPYKLNVNGNLLTGDSANVLWTAAPIPMRAQRQVLMNVSGMFVASPVNTADPIKFTLVNRQAYY